jgi:hypothetical protein
MESTIKKLFVILAIGVSFVAVQTACAETVKETVKGTIDSISFRPPTIVIVQTYENGQTDVIGETEISGMRLNYLCNQYNICLEEGDVVTIEYYEYVCSSGTVILKACNIIVDNATIALRPCPE